MAGHGAGSAAEFGVILVTAIFSFHDQFTIGKIGIVRTLFTNGNVFNRDRDRGRVRFVTIISLASVGSRIRCPAVKNYQRVVIPYNLKIGKQEERHSVFADLSD